MANPEVMPVDTKADKLAMLKKNQDLIDQMVKHLQDPVKVPPPKDEDIYALQQSVASAAFVNGWGGGAG